MLKPGGRLAISDVVQTGALPQELRDNVAALTGCISGATPIREIEEMLHATGFVDVRVRARPDSGSIIDACFPGFDLSGVVASATIEARKAGPASCCEPSCCGG